MITVRYSCSYKSNISNLILTTDYIVINKSRFLIKTRKTTKNNIIGNKSMVFIHVIN